MENNTEETNGYRPVELLTTNGLRYEIYAVSDTLITLALGAIEKKYRARGEPLEKPTYKSELASGGEQEFEHDEESIKGDAEAEAAWALYADAIGRLKAEQQEKKTRMLLAGIEWEERPEWELRHLALGVDVPGAGKKPEEWTREEKEARWYHFLTTEVLVTPDDLFRAVELATNLTYKGAVDEEAVHAAIQSFRDYLQRATVQVSQAETTRQVVASIQTE